VIPDERVGTTIDSRYRILEVLGVGGMGKVFLAEHIHIRRKVAIKLLHHEDRSKSHTQIALRVSSLAQTRAFMEYNGIGIADSYDYGTKDVVCIKDPDDNLIELARYSR
jgi:serine/threonine-protein kinase